MERAVLLVGSTGVGKSTLGNLLAGEEVFKTSDTATSCTQVVQHKTLPNKNLTIIDVPGYEDTDAKRDAHIHKLLESQVSSSTTTTHVWLSIFSCTGQTPDMNDVNNHHETVRSFNITSKSIIVIFNALEPDVNQKDLLIWAANNKISAAGFLFVSKVDLKNQTIASDIKDMLEKALRHATFANHGVQETYKTTIEQKEANAKSTNDLKMQMEREHALRKEHGRLEQERLAKEKEQKRLADDIAAKEAQIKTQREAWLNTKIPVRCAWQDGNPCCRIHYFYRYQFGGTDHSQMPHWNCKWNDGVWAGQGNRHHDPRVKGW